MGNQDLKRMSASKAAPNDRMLIEISKQDIGCHYSSLTDYLDKMAGYDSKLLSGIDRLMMGFHLGAVTKLVNGHYGTVLPRINRNNKVVGGSVQYFDTDSGAILQRESLVEHLYSWYCFDYYTDDEIEGSDNSPRLTCTALTIIRMMRSSLASICFQTSLSPLCRRKKQPCWVRWRNRPLTGWRLEKATISPIT